MTYRQHGWLPQQPPPPTDTNGWGRFVAARLENLTVRLGHLEVEVSRLRDSPASNAFTTKNSTEKDLWMERKETAKEVGTAIRWLAVVFACALLLAKVVTISDLMKIVKTVGGGG